MPTQRDATEIPFYPDDLLSQMQRTLATLAGIELRYEIDRDHLESWSGPREVNDHLLAELEQRYKADREPLVSCLEGLRVEGRGLEPATPIRRAA